MSNAGQLQSSGVMIAINVFVDPSDTGKYLALSSDCAKRFLAEPECNFCEFLQDPENPENLRIVHGWTKDKEWFYNTHMEQEWFRDFQKETQKLWIKPRMIQYFNRVPWKSA